MNLFLDNLKNNPDAIVTIVPPEEAGIALPIVGLIQDDFAMGMQANFNDNYEEGNSQTQEGTQVVAALSAAVGISQRVLGNIRQSLSMYNGAQKPQFQIPLTLVTIRRSDNIMKTVEDLYCGVAPTYSDSGVFMKAPNDYGARMLSTNFRETVNGTWTIQYGRSFRAEHLVLTGVSHIQSKQNVKGTTHPLYCKINLDFQPAIMPDSKIVRSWFIGA